MMETERTCPNCHRPLAPDAPQGLCPECLMKAGFGTGGAPAPGDPTNPPAFTPPPLAEMAKLFPQLEIVELLGRGGMGAVYKARQPALDRWVALKVLPPQSTARAGFAERFNREARALARLSHPNIVAVYDFGQAGDMPYFVMEYVEGVTLRRLVQERRLSPREALRIIPQICEALQFAHDEGVVHRDIKPENILLDTKGRVKIADFGIAKLVTGEEARQSITQDQVIGTPHYMAPEQVEHPQTVDHRADIYSLGVVFYEMLTGELPLGKFQPPSRKVQVDVRLDEVVLRSLEKEPERRYQHASQVKTEVETIAQTPPPSPATDRFWRRFAVAAALVLLALILVPVALTLMGIVMPALHRARMLAHQPAATTVSEAQPDSPRGVKIQYPLAASPPSSAAAEKEASGTSGQASQPVARAKPGEFKVSLDHGVTLELVAVARNPRGTASWWLPDGTPLAAPPVDIIELPKLAPTTQPEITVIPENEFLVYVRRTLPPGTVIESFQPSLTPRPSDIEFPATVRETSSQSRTSAQLVCFTEPPDTADYQEAVACGPWEAVSVYDVAKKSTQDLDRGVMALWSEPRYEQGALRFDVMHNADREQYALRMSARFRSGGHEPLVFHPGVLSGAPAKGFALIHGREQETKAWLQRVKELVIERTPWVRGEICGIALKPR